MWGRMDWNCLDRFYYSDLVTKYLEWVFVERSRVADFLSIVVLLLLLIVIDRIA